MRAAGFAAQFPAVFHAGRPQVETGALRSLHAMARLKQRSLRQHIKTSVMSLQINGIRGQ
jgi:hypothetical protein